MIKKKQTHLQSSYQHNPGVYANGSVSVCKGTTNSQTKQKNEEKNKLLPKQRINLAEVRKEFISVAKIQQKLELDKYLLKSKLIFLVRKRGFCENNDYICKI